MSTELKLRFISDPAEFLDAAGDYLAAQPVVSTVVATVAHQACSDRAEGIAQPDRDWWLVVVDGSGTVVGAAMRTASFTPFPPYLLPMPDAAATALAGALHARGEQVLAINGALPAVQVCATELARLTGGRVEISQHMRLHELDELMWPAPSPGELVAATEDDLDLAIEWFTAFLVDADEQSGHEPGTSAHEAPTRDELLRRIRAGRIWFWVDANRRPVHVGATSSPSYGVCRIGPVYTPPHERGRGWASNAVAELSARIRADGSRVALFTDQANPTSNKIYAALGYRPVVDMASVRILS